MRSRGLCSLALVVAWLALHAPSAKAQLGQPPTTSGVMSPWLTAVTVTPPTVSIAGMITVEAEFKSQAPLSSVSTRVECPGTPTPANVGMMMPVAGSLHSSGGALSQKWKGQARTPVNTTGQHLTCSVSFNTLLGGYSFSLAGGSLTLLRDEGTPQILGFAVTPTAMPADGGLVTVRVTATDDGGIASSLAYVTKPTGQQTGVHLTRENTPAAGMPAGSSTWSVSWTIPSNTAPTLATWGIKVSVTDIVGRSVATQPATLTVAGRASAQERPRGPQTPPGAPRLGPLPAK